MRITMTGAYGFSGKYMARRLLDLRHEVITLTNSPHRSNPFGQSVKAFLYNFSEPKELEKRCLDQHLLGKVRQALALHFCAGARQHEGSVRRCQTRGHRSHRATQLGGTGGGAPASRAARRRVGGMAARSEAASKFGRLGESLDLQEGKEWLLWNSEAKTAISLT
jgi:NAD dependent epimerase/dehydratase family